MLRKSIGGTSMQSGTRQRGPSSLVAQPMGFRGEEQSLSLVDVTQAASVLVEETVTEASNRVENQEEHLRREGPARRN